MATSQRLQRLMSKWRSNIIQRQRRTAARPSPALDFERLEDRTLLSAVTVNIEADNTDADAFLSLREAILLVNAGGDANVALGRALTVEEQAQVDLTTAFGVDDTILFDASLDGVDIELGAEIPITVDLTITGNGALNTVIDANLGSRIFNISGAGVEVALEDLTLTGGSSVTAGGAILSTSDQTLRISGSIVTDNHSDGDGGAISAAADVEVLDSTFSINTSGGVGGAISTSGAVNVSGSVFAENEADGDGGAIHASGSAGVVTVLETTVRGNESGGAGGAIHAEFGAEVTRSTLNANTAVSAGGAVYVASTGGVSLVNSTLSGNTTTGAGGQGGAVFALDVAAEVVVSSSTVVHNENLGAGGIGGGISASNVFAANSIIALNTSDSNADLSVGASGEFFGNIIGVDAGTGLSATIGLTPDLNGNFVGSVATPLVPLIGSLQLNGGVTATHALLPGSLGINTGISARATVTGEIGDTALTVDQRGSARITGPSVDIGAVEYDGIVIIGDTATVSGTNDDDVFVFDAQTNTLTVNGQVTILPPTVQLVVIDGLDGFDRLTLTGTVGDDTFVLRPGSALLEHNSLHAGFDFQGVNIEHTIALGGGGTDTAFLEDSADDDIFTVSPTTATLLPQVGGAFHLEVEGMSTIVGRSIHGGVDMAVMLDSTGDDVFASTTALANLAGAGFFNSAVGFFSIEGRSSAGADAAFLQDSDGDDEFAVVNGVADISGSSFFRRARDFATVSVSAMNGGTDSATLRDSAGDDVFVSRAGVSFIRGGGLFVEAVGFENVSAHATLGGFDQAFFVDSSGDDEFTATIDSANMQSTGLFRSATGFDVAAAWSLNGGVDTATLFDSSGDDVLDVEGGLVNFAGEAFLMQTLNFSDVEVRATAGGFDRAFFTDSPGDDQFLGTGADARITSGAFVSAANLFDEVTIRGINGGLNTVELLNIAFVLHQEGTWTVV